MDLAVLAKRANAIADPAMRAEARAKVIDLALPAKQKCEYCDDPATKRVLHSEGMAYIPCCDMHLDKAKEAAMLSTPDGTRDPSNINKIMDMSSSEWVAGVIDLALTKDGRKSFKGTGGKFKHGFIPLDNTAKVAKAKGSPIAMKRMNRLFGGASAGAKGAKKFLTKKPKRAKPGIQVGIRAKKGTGTERVQDVGQSQRLEVRDATRTQKVKPIQLEASRGRRPTKRSNQRWEDLKESEKTVRNGKRYVLTTYNGRQSLTEWVGPDNNADVAAPDKRDKVMTNITPGDLKKLTTAALRRMLEQPNVSPAMRKLLNAELNRKEKLGLVGGKTR